MAPRCMSCSALIESLKHADQTCPSPTSNGRRHILSIGDEIRLGRKFKAKDLREWLGPNWKAEVEAAKAGR